MTVARLSSFGGRDAAQNPAYRPACDLLLFSISPSLAISAQSLRSELFSPRRPYTAHFRSGDADRLELQSSESFFLHPGGLRRANLPFGGKEGTHEPAAPRAPQRVPRARAPAPRLPRRHRPDAIPS